MDRHTESTESTPYTGKHDEKEAVFARAFFTSALFAAIAATAALWGSFALLG